jgi:uncharacterized protein YbjT (DUF2867 family)
MQSSVMTQQRAVTNKLRPNIHRRVCCFMTGVERNAIIGDDAAARKKDIPIIQLNPGGVLNWKYEAECVIRASGLPYTVIRCTGTLLPFSLWVTFASNLF